MDYAYKVFLLLGGIGLFLFGINYMSASLEEAAGPSLRRILEKLTAKSYVAVLVGAAVTAVIQSSGATMVMVIGFINAQMMSLVQGLYVMLGAAIGTTVTGLIIAFKIDTIAPLILFVGALIFLFIKKKKVRQIGAIILGFGLLFTGIYIMGDAISALNLGVVVQGFLDRFSNPLLSLLFGFVFTFIIQSCSASVGILQVIAMSMGSASFGLGSVVYIILGMNVGAVAPVIISSFSGGRAARRAAGAEIASKLLSVVLFSVLMLLFPGIISGIEQISGPDLARQIANFHLIFNIISAIVLLPLIKPLAKITEKLAPVEEADPNARKLIYLSDAKDITPVTLVSQAKKEVLRFAGICRENFSRALDAFFACDAGKADKVEHIEEEIDDLCQQLNTWLIRHASSEVGTEDAARLGKMINVVTDLERIADHADNIAEYTQRICGKEAEVSADALSDLKKLSDKVLYMVDLSIRTFEENDAAGLGMATVIEDEVDNLSNLCDENHVSRLITGVCNPRGGILFTDMVSDLERVSDHALNVAEAIQL